MISEQASVGLQGICMAQPGVYASTPMPKLKLERQYFQPDLPPAKRTVESVFPLSRILYPMKDTTDSLKMQEN
ncbi:MAG: hypothetical protein GKS03_08400 [Alphaproteobacteria bacterium]|nr:hypothetical protein [Alphaproteobacteria bacterium]